MTLSCQLIPLPSSSITVEPRVKKLKHLVSYENNYILKSRCIYYTSKFAKDGVKMLVSVPNRKKDSFSIKSYSTWSYLIVCLSSLGLPIFRYYKKAKYKKSLFEGAVPLSAHKMWLSRYI